MTVHDHPPRTTRPGRRRLLPLAATAALIAAAGLVPSAGLAAADGGGAPDFGPNVFIYDPTTPVAQIQAKLDALSKQKAGNEMGTDRYAVLFKPGSYNVNARLGY